MVMSIYMKWHSTVNCGITMWQLFSQELAIALINRGTVSRLIDIVNSIRAIYIQRV